MTQEVTQVRARYGSYPLDIDALIRLGVIGMVSGVIGWLLYVAIANYFVAPVFCSSPATFSVCKNGGTIAWVAAHVIASAAMLAAMIRFRVFRPLLVIIGVIASLWATHAWLGGMMWYVGLFWHALLFAIAAMLFGWVSRVVNFWVALLLVIGLVIAARFVLISA